MSKTLIRAKPTAYLIIAGTAKEIREEISQYLGCDGNSILRDDNEAVKNFSWETVWLELCYNLPT